MSKSLRRFGFMRDLVYTRMGFIGMFMLIPFIAGLIVEWMRG